MSKLGTNQPSVNCDQDPVTRGEERLESTNENDANSNILNDEKKGKKERPYQSDAQKPLASHGNTSVTLAEAILFGLLNENGEVKIKAKSILNNDHIKMMQKNNEISRPKSDIIVCNVESGGKENVFRPKRSKEADEAMKKCGYDFAGQLESRGDFLDRATSKLESEKSKKSQLAFEEDNYKARLDKLMCPSCGKEQSFDEFVERRRQCSQCKVRFVQGKVANRSLWDKKQKEDRERRELNLKKIQTNMYDPNLFKPTLTTDPKTILSQAKDKTKMLGVQEKTELLMREKTSIATNNLQRRKEEEDRRKQEFIRRQQARIDAMNNKIVRESGLPPPPVYEASKSKEAEDSERLGKSSEAHRSNASARRERPASAAVALSRTPKSAASARKGGGRRANRDELFDKLQELVPF